MDKTKIYILQVRFVGFITAINISSTRRFGFQMRDKDLLFQEGKYSILRSERGVVIESKNMEITSGLIDGKHF